MSETVSVRIKIDDAGSFKQVQVDAEDLRDAVRAVKEETDRLKSSVINWAQAAQAADMFQQTLESLQSALGNLASGFIEDQTNLAKLGQAMRNTMGATKEQIDSIDALCEAQERSGVTSKGAQLAGAQELATYLELSSSLETLIPVLNDMVAQQLGVGASGESVAQIASMLGKVMNGQTEALSRYGYKFDEAQKYILQFGDETERAAVLADVVSESVGGMSQALRDTAEGALFAAQTQTDSLKDAFGSLAARIMPVVNSIASIAVAGTGIIKLTSSFKSLSAAMGLAKIESLACAVNMKVQAVAARLLGASSTAAVASVTALRVATAALYATMTLGLSLAIQGVVTLFTRLTSASSGAASGLREADEATSAYRDAAASARAEIAKEIVEIEGLIKAKAEESAKVTELNDKYGRSFGTYGTLSEWYETLTGKSEAYCRQLGYQARAEKLIEEQSKALVDLGDVRKRRKRMEDEGKTTSYVAVTTSVSAGGASYVEAQNPEYAALLASEKELEAKVKETEAAIKEAAAEAAKAAGDMAAGAAEAAEATDWQTMSLTNLNKEIQKQRQLVADKAGTDAAAAKAASEELKRMEERAASLGSAYGLATTSSGSASKGVTQDIAAYRESVSRAVEVNSALNGGLNESVVELRAMSSGITALINKYGLENAEVRRLVEEYNALRKARGGSLISEPLARPEGAAGLTGKAEPARSSGLAKATKETKDYSSAQREAVDSQAAVQTGVGALSSTFGSLSSVVGEAAGAWLEWIGNLLNAIAQAIPAITALATARKGEATANAAASITGGAASVASIPWVGAAMAVAAAASIAAAFAAMPKFAAGGIAFGPTIGMFGEYAGASTNPEVVAPLNRLRSLLGVDAGATATLRFKIEGRDLVAVCDRRRNLVGRV